MKCGRSVRAFPAVRGIGSRQKLLPHPATLGQFPPRTGRQLRQNLIVRYRRAALYGRGSDAWLFERPRATFNVRAPNETGRTAVVFVEPAHAQIRAGKSAGCCGQRFGGDPAEGGRSCTLGTYNRPAEGGLSQTVLTASLSICLLASGVARGQSDGNAPAAQACRD
jgi:hypothetical protein